MPGTLTLVACDGGLAVPVRLGYGLWNEGTKSGTVFHTH